MLANFFDWDSSFKTCLQPGLGAKKVEKHCVRALSISYNFGFKWCDGMWWTIKKCEKEADR